MNDVIRDIDVLKNAIVALCEGASVSCLAHTMQYDKQDQQGKEAYNDPQTTQQQEPAARRPRGHQMSP